MPPWSSILALRPDVGRDGSLRARGRLQELDGSEEVKHPILLPSDHVFTRLLVAATHVSLLHVGVQVTLLDLWSRFCIVKGRRAVRKVLLSCLLCCCRRLLPASVPVTPLLKDRIAETSPFDVVGVDFCRPLYCRSTQQSVKLYIVVFSCAVTRPVHLEITSDMTTRAFILAFRRFTSRRGIPSTVYSDNTKAFLSCTKQLHSLPRTLSRTTQVLTASTGSSSPNELRGWVACGSASSGQSRMR